MGAVKNQFRCCACDQLKNRGTLRPWATRKLTRQGTNVKVCLRCAKKAVAADVTIRSLAKIIDLERLK